MNLVAIDVNKVDVRFGGFHALRDVTFSVPSGAFVSVIGPNGAGKTTLLNVVLGLQPVTNGDVHFFGKPREEFSATDIGYVPQLKTLDRTFPAVAVELVVTGLRRSWPWRVTPQERAAALEIMERIGVARVADTPIGRLSGGELQRVYLARILIRRPCILLLDEPGSGMDLVGEVEMYHLLGEYQKESGATVMMITHDWEGARYHSSHVLLMDKGLIGFGPPQEVARQDRLLQVFGYTGHRAASVPGIAHD